MPSYIKIEIYWKLSLPVHTAIEIVYKREMSQGRKNLIEFRPVNGNRGNHTSTHYIYEDFINKLVWTVIIVVGIYAMTAIYIYLFQMSRIVFGLTP